MSLYRCPQRAKDQPFLMPIEDVFTIKGRGTVPTGRVERGVVKVGDEVDIVGLHHEPRRVTITGLEMFHKMLDQAEAGDAIGALLRGVEREDLERGMVLAAPGSIKPHTYAEAEVYVLTKDEGGRHTPFFQAISRSSTSARRMSPAPSSCRRAWKWSCLAIT